MRPIAIVLVDPMRDAATRFLQAAMEPYDEAVALRVVISRSALISTCRKPAAHAAKEASDFIDCSSLGDDAPHEYVGSYPRISTTTPEPTLHRWGACV
jgi:hypothetical protein